MKDYNYKTKIDMLRAANESGYLEKQIDKLIKEIRARIKDKKEKQKT